MVTSGYQPVRSMRLLVGLLLPWLGSACESGGAPPPACDPDGWIAAWSADGLPEPGAPPEWVWRSDGIVLERPESGYMTHFWLPWDFNRRGSYPLRGDDSVYARVEFMIADDATRAGL